MYDAIVVGARCAGSPTAMLLARKGYRVLLVDRATFPSDTMSTHYMQAPATARMERWGLLDRLKATNAPALPKITMHIGDAVLVPPRFPTQTTDAYCPRRIILDKILVDAAVEAGAELREDFPVRELIFEDGAVRGVRGGRDGQEIEERARLVVGADGVHSLIARIVQPQEYHVRPTMTFGYYSYFSGVEHDGAEMHITEQGGMLMFPTNDDCVCLGVGGPVDAFHEFRSDIEGNFARIVDLAPDLSRRIRGGHQEAKFQGTADQPNYFRKPYGPGWALVGDAGYHRDFITGLGIMDAFRDAELLADALDAGFSGRQPLEEALAGYQATRDDIALPLYEFTLTLASLTVQPGPEMFMKFGLAMTRT